MMDKLTFALYGSQSQFIESIFPVLKTFETESQIQLQTLEMSFEEAWPQLLQYTLYGGGPDLARVGTIWTSSLVSLNSLRPFSQNEIASLGGEQAFFRPIWQSCVHPVDDRVWAIPFTIFNYALFYRRDVLAKSGIDTEQAFSSPQAMLDTLAQLSASGVQSPWIIPTSEHFRARLHILASWIWGAGGHFLSEDGKQILLGDPKALAGLKAFFELHRYLSPSDYGLSPNECRRRYARGQTAMIIGGPDTLRFLRNMNPAPSVIENTAVAALPGTPWIGGSSFVVWNDVLSDPQKERAVMRLINFLTGKTTQKQIYHLSEVLPARSEALLELELEPSGLLEIEKKVLETGRSYRPYPIWVRIQNDLVRIFDQITLEYLEDTSKDVLPIIQKYTDPVVKRYNMILSAM
jgi:multiple sugar transport system substrate-binding protein